MTRALQGYSMSMLLDYSILHIAGAISVYDFAVHLLHRLHRRKQRNQCGQHDHIRHDKCQRMMVRGHALPCFFLVIHMF